MKTVTIMLFTLLSICANGQDWKEYGVTENGDTISTGDSIHIKNIGSVNILNVVSPHYRYPDDAWFIYRNHIAFMRNGTYEITRMTRMQVRKKPKKYRPVAIIESKHASTLLNIEYCVSVDSALNMGYIEIVKQSHP